MYHAEKAKWQRACKALGRPHDDAALRALHASVGAPHSFTRFQQDDLTRVIGAFKSLSAMDDLNAQIKAQRTHKEALLEDISALAIDCQIKDGLEGVSRYYHRWLHDKPVNDVDESTLQKLVGMMKARKAQLAPAQSEVPADPDFDPSAPFG